MRAASAACALLTPIACAEGVEPRREALPAGLPGRSIGAAGQRVNEYGWEVTQAIDFNADGMADAVWHHVEQNLMAVWLMEGTGLLAPGPVIPGPLGDGWDVVWGADFNGDGMADVLWNNTEQNLLAVWPMEGSQLLVPGPFIPGPLGDGWAARTAGDVNLDGMADVVWQRAGTSEMTVWLMEGSHLLAPGPVIPGPHDGG